VTVGIAANLLDLVNCLIQSDCYREPALFRANVGDETIETVEDLAPPVTLFGRQERQSSAHWNSPFLSKLPHHLLGREIEVDLGRGEMVMAQEPLKRRQRDALLDCRDREGVAQHMGGHGAADAGPIGHALDQDLHSAGRHAHGVVQGEMALQEGLDARRQGNDAPLGPGAIRTALAIDREAVTLPVDIVFCELREFRDPKPSVKQRPDHELLLVRLARVGQAGRLILGQRFAFELIGHRLK
jgi:hypothetical protein